MPCWYRFDSVYVRTVFLERRRWRNDSLDVQPTCYPSLYFGDCGFVEPSVTLPKYKFSLAKGRRSFSQKSIDCIDCVIADLYVLSLGGVLEMIPVILFAAMCLSGLTTLCYWGEWANRDCQFQIGFSISLISLIFSIIVLIFIFIKKM